VRVLVIGGYGFIGRAVGEALLQRGHHVVGWGRSAELGRRLLPAADWIEGDLNRLCDASSWRDALKGVDIVINASGALQDAPGANLAKVQGQAIVALIDACVAAGTRRFVQISAPGATAVADTRFMSTKGFADAHLRASALDWLILRPTLVIGRNAYGGTALIRALAALPVQLTVHGTSLVQCVALDDVALACADAVEGRLAARSDLVLTAPEMPTLGEVVALHRRWLGLPPAWLSIDLPATLSAPVAWLADAAGWLGWRSPLRSTALRLMRRGVVASDTAVHHTGSLAQIFAGKPAGMQDRVWARLFLLEPLITLTLAALWIGSGTVGLIESHRAAAILGGSGHVVALVWGCSMIDLLLGAAILVRASARTAAVGMAVISAAYLIAGTILAPGLWLDPLAPLLKIGPAFLLALVAAAILDRR
jgi:uncharacterized protein YbjT (DUF2867 family)